MVVWTGRHASRRWRWRAGGAAVVAVVLVLTGCDGNGGGSDEPDGPDVTAVILDPADAAGDVATAPEITFSTENAVETTIELTGLDEAPVDGELTEDGDAWRPATQLEYGTTYVATLTAVAENGENAIATSTFTTMAEPDQQLRVRSFLGADAEVGVAMPLRIMFWEADHVEREVPEEFRAEIERRLTVRTDPPQEGSWHWVNGAELHYRPREFWEPGTRITYRAVTGGLAVGDDWYLANDLNVSVSVGRDIRMEVDNEEQQLVIEVDGEVERTIPVSLGRTDYPSSSGTFVIMEKYPEFTFDTREQFGPDEGYVVDVEFAMRLTREGEFIHADVRDGSALGNENVTHGCMNMAQDNAEWLYELTHNWGDPVTVSGTSSRWEQGNGWTDWNLDWDEYQRGSALYQDES